MVHSLNIFFVGQKITIPDRFFGRVGDANHYASECPYTKKNFQITKGTDAYKPAGLQNILTNRISMNRLGEGFKISRCICDLLTELVVTRFFPFEVALFL